MRKMEDFITDARAKEALQRFVEERTRPLPFSFEELRDANPEEAVILKKQAFSKDLDRELPIELMLDLLGEYELAGKLHYFTSPRFYIAYTSEQNFEEVRAAFLTFAESAPSPLIAQMTRWRVYDDSTSRSEEDLRALFLDPATSPFLKKGKQDAIFCSRVNGAYFALALERPDMARPHVEQAIKAREKKLKLDPFDPAYDPLFEDPGLSPVNHELRALAQWLLALEAKDSEARMAYLLAGMVPQLISVAVRYQKEGEKNTFFQAKPYWSFALLAAYGDPEWARHTFPWRFDQWAGEWCFGLWRRARSWGLWAVSPESQGWPSPDDVVAMGEAIDRARLANQK